VGVGLGVGVDRSGVLVGVDVGVSVGVADDVGGIVGSSSTQLASVVPGSMHVALGKKVQPTAQAPPIGAAQSSTPSGRGQKQHPPLVVGVGVAVACASTRSEDAAIRRIVVVKARRKTRQRTGRLKWDIY